MYPREKKINKRIRSLGLFLEKIKFQKYDEEKQRNMFLRYIRLIGFDFDLSAG